MSVIKNLMTSLRTTGHYLVMADTVTIAQLF